MNVNINIIQINICKLNAFSNQQIYKLISELNVHYGKINNYIESKIDSEKVNIELIDALTKLEEIDRLSPYRIESSSNSDDFSFGKNILISIIALLNTSSGHESTRNKLLTLGWTLLDRLYSISCDKIIYESLLYHWLKSKNLVRSRGAPMRSYGNHVKSEKFEFTPSDKDIEDFYQKNKQEIYKYMILKMSENQIPGDPFTDSNTRDFYHYHQTLSSIKA